MHIDQRKKQKTQCISPAILLRFEDLPNELIYLILQHLNGNDIYRAFSDLNNRFDQLLCGLISLNVDLSIDSQSDITHQCKNIIIPNHYRIRSLRLNNSSIVTLFLDHCRLNSSFSVLQSIVLESITESDVQRFLFFIQSLPGLVSLTLTIEKTDSYYNTTNLGHIYQMLFSLLGSKYLKLSLFTDDYQKYLVPFSQNQSFSSIEHLVIDHWCKIDQLCSILRHTPQLRRLTLKELRDSEDQIDVSLIPALPNLEHFVIRFCSSRLNHLETFINELSCHPHILHIELQLAKVRGIPPQWQTFIGNKATHLRKFQITSYEWVSQCDTAEQNRTIDLFTWPFWTMSHWLCELTLCPDKILYSFQSTTSDASLRSSSSFTLSIVGFRHRHWKSTLLVRIQSYLVAIHFSHLNLEDDNIDISTLISIINQLPHLVSLKISSFSSTSFECPDNMPSNKIIRLQLVRVAHSDQVQVLIRLFPCLQYLVIDDVASREQFGKIIGPMAMHLMNTISSPCCLIQP